MGAGLEGQLQRERFKLFDQEYGYYSAANRDRLPALPDLSDSSGGLANRAYFNFVSYIGWKVAARHAATPEQRTALCRRVGELLLPQVAPGELEALRAEAARSPNGAVSEAAAARAVSRLLASLQACGYICGWQVVWGDTPGGWPQDWFQQAPGLVGDVPGGAPGAALQDDLAGIVEMEGAPGQRVFQVKLLQPADIQASVALRSEDDGFWGRHASAMVGALLAAGGWRCDASEYFYQDDWSGPTSLGARLLLALGDPLQAVDIPWTPTTLVGDYTCQPAAAA
ncbi:MAG: hypothetical protein J3K34DRAFT_448048 [Monoraphidium minutum]|nr:MAG: hypothetical protein J3K34DRAFT_448048 [Monoraphidium minutum]